VGAGRLTLVESDGLEARVTALESQVHDLTERVRVSEQDAAAARVLAGAADRDVSEFRDELRDFRRATVTSFNAMREDFTTMRADMGSMRQDIDSMREYMYAMREDMDNGFIEMRGKFDATAAGQQQIVELLQGLIADQS
jgi:outer membrane murein-binding lipoprotein Lpp